MEDAEDFDPVRLGSDTIRDDVARSGDYQLPGPLKPTRTANGRTFSRQTNRTMHKFDHGPSRRRIFSRDGLGLAIQIPQRRREPPNLHRRPTCP